MSQLDRFLTTALARGVEVVQAFPDDCLPIRAGKVALSLDGMVCGDTPEPASKVARAAAQRLG